VDDGVVAAVVSKCTQLSALNLGSCSKITDAAVVAVAYAAVVAVASGCKSSSRRSTCFTAVTSPTWRWWR
jgi:hypothetical protein